MPCHGETYKNPAVRVLGGYAAIKVFLSKEWLADIVLKGSAQRKTMLLLWDFRAKWESTLGRNNQET